MQEIGYGVFRGFFMFKPGVVCLVIVCFYLLIVPDVLVAQNLSDAGAQVAVQASTNDRARALLDAALKVNGLFTDELKPWHLTATVTRFWHEPKPVYERADVWFAARYKWRNGVEREGKRSLKWRISRTETYQSPQFYDAIWDPFSNPLGSAGYLRPGIELELKHVDVGVPLDCVSVDRPERFPKSARQAFYPSFCFDNKLRLRLSSYGQIVAQFDTYRIFQGRQVAGHVKLAANGSLLNEAKLDSLELMDPVDEQIWKPDQDAIKNSYQLEAGDPEPVAIHREAGPTYLAADKIRPNVLVLVPAILQKDGSVKVPKNGQLSYRQADGQITSVVATTNAISNSLSIAPRFEPMIAAAGRWKFEPYKIEGEAVEVWMMIPFTEDGKPWKAD